MKTGYYAVARGRSTGIYRTWAECKKQVNCFQNARYKKFATESEALAFIEQNRKKCTASNFLLIAEATDALLHCDSSVVQWNCSEIGTTIFTRESAHDEMSEGIPVVYTDGACSANGHAKAAAGIGVYWGEEHSDNISEPLLNGPQTNNRAELTAVIRALETGIKRGYEQLIVRTDSNLLIQTMRSWIHNWRRNGWKTACGTAVKNQDLIVQLDNLLKNIKVHFEHVAGHAGILGNERADELARRGIISR